MSKTVKKVFFAWQLDKEQLWLEEMAKQGYLLESIGLFRYTFKEVEPCEVVYQFDFQILNKKTEQEYLEMFRDWTLVDRFGAWYYFYKKKDEDNNSIYSDNTSKKDMFQRLMLFLCIIGFPLYYQILIMFPNMEESELQFPNFYFFFRIIVLIFMVLHFSALLNVFLAYRSFQNKIKE